MRPIGQTAWSHWFVVLFLPMPLWAVSCLHTAAGGQAGEMVELADQGALIRLGRTHERAVYDQDVGPIADVTDDYRIFPLRVRQPTRLELRLTFGEPRRTEVLISPGRLEPGRYFFVVAYDDIARRIGDTGEFTLELVYGSEGEESVRAYRGVLVSYVTAGMLGRVVVSDLDIYYGGLTLARLDLTYEGRGPDLDLRRLYTNRSYPGEDSSAIGPGWLLSEDIRLRVVASSKESQPNNLPAWVVGRRLKILPLSDLPDDDGEPSQVFVNATHFKKVGQTWRPERGRHGRLREVDGGFIYTSLDSTSYYYPRPRRRPFNWAVGGSSVKPACPTLSFSRAERSAVRWIEDSNKNRKRFEYLDHGCASKLATVTDAVGRSLTFEYEGRTVKALGAPSATRLVAVKGVGGELVRYRYDQATGMLCEVQVGESVERYTYDEQAGGGSSRRYNLARFETDPDGQSLVIGYAASGQTPASFFALHPGVEAGDVISEVGPSNEPITKLELDPSEPNTRILTSGSRRTIYRMNAYGNPLEIRNPDGSVRRFTWSIDQGLADNVLISTSEQEGRVRRLEHDSYGKTVKEVDPQGRVTLQEWDPRWAKLIKKTFPDGTSIINTYDDSGNLVAREGPDSKKETFEYNRFGELVAKTSAGERTTIHRDAVGRKVSESVNGVKTIDYKYDPNGRLRRMTSPGGHMAVSFKYDDHGRLAMIERQKEVVRYSYDLFGQQRESVIKKPSIGRPDAQTGLPKVGSLFSRMKDGIQSIQGYEVFEDLNFRFRLPGRSWSKLDSKAINPEVALALLRADPIVGFLVIGEVIGVELAVDTGVLLETVKARMRTISRKFELLDQSAAEVAGLAGIRMKAVVRIGRRDLNYIVFMACRNGFCYQLMGYGSSSLGESLDQVVDGMFERFELIDPQRIARNKEENRFGLHSSDLFGFSIDLSDTAWSKSTRLSQDNPAAEIGGVHGRESGFLVVPFYFDDPTLGLDELTGALLSTLGQEFPDRPPGRVVDKKVKSGKTKSFEFTRKVGDESYLYKVKIVQKDKRVFMVVVWGPARLENLGELAEQVFSRLVIAPADLAPLRFDSLPDRFRSSHSQMINNIGLFHYRNKNYTRALVLFRRAAGLNQDSLVYVENCLDAFNKLGKSREAMAYIETLPADKKSADSVQAWEAWYLQQIGKTSGALAVYRSLFGKGYRGIEDLGIFTRMLADAGGWREIESVYQKVFKADDSLKLRLQKATLLADYKKYKQAITLLKGLLGRGAPNPDVALALISVYESTEQYSESLALCERLISSGTKSALVYYKKALAEYNLKWIRQARASLEKALAVSPEDKDIKDFYNEVSGMLGSGDNSTIKDEIAPVSLPKKVARAIGTADESSASGDSSAFYSHRVVGVAFDRGRSLKRTIRLRVRVLDEGGVNAFSTMDVDFDPLSEDVYVNTLVVRDQKGEVVASGNPSDYYVIDKQGDAMASHDKTLFIPVPNLTPGKTIDLTYTVASLGHPIVFPFEQFTFARTRPASYLAFYFLGDRSQVKYECLHGPEPIQIEQGLLWQMKDPIPYRYEPLEPRIEESLPILFLADATGSWNGEAESYLESIRDKLADQDEVVAFARKLTEGAETDQERIWLLARFVQKSITYKPIEFGRRARIPASAGQTLENKYGDCKDHAVLLHKLLSAVSVESSLALVNTRMKIFEKLPSLDQFNHLIVYVPGSEKTKFIDATDKGYDVADLSPLGLASREAFVLDGEKSRFVEIPRYDRDSSRLEDRLSIEVAGESDLLARQTLKVSGYYSTGLRSTLKGIESSKHHAWMQNLLSSYLDAAELKSFSVHNLFDNREDLVLDTEFTVRDRVTRQGKDIAIEPPDVWMRYFLALQAVAGRTKEFVIEYPLTVDYRSRLIAPGSCSFDEAQSSSKAEADYAQWTFASRFEPRAVLTRFEAHLVPGKYAAQEYPRYRSSMDRAIRSLTLQVRCRIAGP